MQARHSWATCIALNKVELKNIQFHAALNHIDEAMKVTDIYIERDFVNENNANAKVINYIILVKISLVVIGVFLFGGKGYIGVILG